MRFLFYAPLRFEVPKQFLARTKIFGMGIERAKSLGAQLNRMNLGESKVVVFGCAGALRKDIQLGQAFVIDRLKAEGVDIQLPSSAGFSSLPKASLTTSPTVVGTISGKQSLHASTHADLVDMEMLSIWNACEPSTRESLIFLRGVIDTADHELTFAKDVGGLDPWKLFRWQALKDLIQFRKNRSLYISGIQDLLRLVVSI